MRAFSVLALVLLSSLVLISATKRSAEPQPQPPPQPGPVYLWPMPASVSQGYTVRHVSYPFVVNGFPAFPDLTNAIPRFLSTAFSRRAVGDSGIGALQGVQVEVRDINAPLQLYTDESYTLSVPLFVEETMATITANTYYGALHGLETLSQLIYFNFSSSTYFIPSAPWAIIDAPRFHHRGMLVDTARHYQTLPIIRRIIDSLAYSKSNVFHWHLSDDQSFPWHSEAAPLLSSAAYSPAERYSSADIADVVEYARQRGVRVMIEFDVPGHATSWCTGYPSVCPSSTCLNILDPTSNVTFDLMARMFNELTGGRNRGGVAPEDLFHLGGDEVDTSCWTSTPHISTWLTANNLTTKDAYRYVVERAHALVYAAGRTPVNWDDVYGNFKTTIDPQTIIHVWSNEANVAQATRDGFRVLVSPDGPWYLDQLTMSWQEMYMLEPMAGITDPMQQSLVLGGESTMWGETVDASLILATIWPRAAAVAERLWSPMNVTSTITAEPRYAWFRCLLDQRGIEAGPYTNQRARSQPSGPGGCYMQ